MPPSRLEEWFRSVFFQNVRTFNLFSLLLKNVCSGALPFLALVLSLIMFSFQFCYIYRRNCDSIFLVDLNSFVDITFKISSLLLKEAKLR